MQVQMAREEKNASKAIPEQAQSATARSQYCCSGGAALRRLLLPTSDWQRTAFHRPPSAPLAATQHVESSMNLKALHMLPSKAEHHKIICRLKQVIFVPTNTHSK